MNIPKLIKETAPSNKMYQTKKKANKVPRLELISKINKKHCN